MIYWKNEDQTVYKTKVKGIFVETAKFTTLSVQADSSFLSPADRQAS